jgi:hypothetical protein
MTIREYYLTEKVIKNLKAKGKTLTCAFCDKPLEKGQKVHRNSNARHFYHAECWKKLFH